VICENGKRGGPLVAWLVMVHGRVRGDSQEELNPETVEGPTDFSLRSDDPIALLLNEDLPQRRDPLYADRCQGHVEPFREQQERHDQGDEETAPGDVEHLLDPGEAAAGIAYQLWYSQNSSRAKLKKKPKTVPKVAASRGFLQQE